MTKLLSERSMARLARQLGDPRHLALAYAGESHFVAMTDPHSSKSARLARLAAASAERAPNPDVKAFLELQASARAFWEGTMAEAVARSEAAESAYANECPGEVWLHTVTRGQHIGGLFVQGHHARFATLAESRVREADRRGDAFGLALYAVVSLGALRHLLIDAPDKALAEIKRAAAPWQSGRRGLISTHFRTAQLWISAYQAEPAPRARRRLFLAGPLVFSAARMHWRAIAANEQLQTELIAGARMPSSQLVATVRELLQAPVARCQAYGHLLAAQLTLLETDRSAAATHARAAEARFQVEAMELHSAAAAALLAAAQSPQGATRALDTFRAALRQEGWKNVNAAAGLIFPLARMRPTLFGDGSSVSTTDGSAEQTV